MALLIRGGTLITMTQQRSIVADILVSHGRILQVAEHIDEPAVVASSTFDAQGLTILPGLVDACLSAGGARESELTQHALQAGITAGMILPTDGNVCRLMRSGSANDSPYRLIDPAEGTNDALSERLAAFRSAGYIPVWRVGCAEECSAVLSAPRGKGAVLLGCTGCESLAGRIAEAGMSAVVSMDRHAEKPWALAASLMAAGVTVSVSSFYPASDMSRLPVFAGMLRYAGFGGLRALRCITCGAAELLGLTDCGCIAPGYRADLTFYDGAPLLLSTSLVAVMVEGCFVSRG